MCFPVPMVLFGSSYICDFSIFGLPQIANAGLAIGVVAEPRQIGLAGPPRLDLADGRRLARLSYLRPVYFVIPGGGLPALAPCAPSAPTKAPSSGAANGGGGAYRTRPSAAG